MTNTPGDDQNPQDPYGDDSQGQRPGEDQPEQPYGEPGQQPYGGQYGDTSGQYGQYGAQPGSWEQQGQQPPYGQGYPSQPQAQYAPDHPRSTTVLVLGILGVVVCQLIAPFAWSMGKRALDEIDASHGQLGGRGAVQAGYILGIVGTVLLALGILFFIFMFGIIGLGTWSSYN